MINYKFIQFQNKFTLLWLGMNLSPTLIFFLFIRFCFYLALIITDITNFFF